MRRRFGLALAVLLFALGAAHAAEQPSAAAPQMGGWFERAVTGLESEFASDVSMAPDGGDGPRP